jgi:GH24 family phage-related lysozyme (muramidase)
MCNIIEKIKTRIKQKEGCNLDVRERINSDGRKEIFVGYGHNILPADGLKVGQIITQDQAEEFFKHDFFWVLSQVKQIIPNFDEQPDNIKIVLCDMAYNNGIGGLRGYKKFVENVIAKNYTKAADEIVDSNNYRRKDLHGRYVELENLTRGTIV